MRKRRLSVSIDGDIVEAAKAAVHAGRAPSVSAWVEDALRAKVTNEERLAALGDALRMADARWGAMCSDDLRAVERRVRADAIVVRPRDSA